MRVLKHLIAIVAATWWLVGCEPANLPTLDDQMWGPISVHVESRPMPLTAGMNEFWVVLTDDRGRPMFDVLVNVRIEPHGSSQQAIQDGHTGVYRRAVRIADPKTNVLVVELKRRDKTGELRFPLAKIAG